MITDIMDICAPQNLGWVSTGYVYDVDVSGRYAYLAVGGLQVVDVLDPTSPVLITTYSVTGARQLEVRGDRAYMLSRSENKLTILDVSDPANPARLDSIAVQITNYDGVLAVDGNHMLLSDDNQNVLLYDISEDSPVLLSTHFSGHIVRDAILEGSRVFLADDLGYVMLGIDAGGNLFIEGYYDPPVDEESDGYWSVCRVGDVIWVGGESKNPTSYAYGFTIPTPPNAESYDYILDMEQGGLHVRDLMGYCDHLIRQIEFHYDFHVWQVANRRFQYEQNLGLSLPLNDYAGTISAARLEANSHGTIEWFVSASDGYEQAIPADGQFHSLDVEGESLRWKALLDMDACYLNPTVYDLEIEWRYACGVITSVLDIPDDQGGQVRLRWLGSGHDVLGSETPVTDYAIYRRIDRAGGEAAEAQAPDAPDREYPPGDWDFIATVPATADESYSMVVPTLADSSIADGMHWSVFFVRALTETPGVYWNCPPDSGYSVDNLAPHVPSGLVVERLHPSGNDLSWEDPVDEDFQYFNIYRGDSEDFEPAPGNRVHQTTGAAWTDTEGQSGHFYKISAVDFHGNESDFAGAEEIVGVPGEDLPAAFALHPNSPNPFNPRTIIRFDLPVDARAVLTIYDVAGRCLRILLNETMPAGRHGVIWDGRDEQGVSQSSGVYFYRLEVGAFADQRKMMMLE
jgi:hypothetical protein